MITTNINAIFYKILNTESILANIKGSVFNGNRPLDRNSEDICIVQVSQSGIRPQIGTTDINVHVPDLTITVNGETQQAADTARLETLTSLVEQVLDAAVVGNFVFQIDGKSIVETSSDHYYSIVVSWVCVDDSTNVSKDYYTKSEIDAKFEELKSLIQEG